MMALLLRTSHKKQLKHLKIFHAQLHILPSVHTATTSHPTYANMDIG